MGLKLKNEPGACSAARWAGSLAAAAARWAEVGRYSIDVELRLDVEIVENIA